MTIKFKLGALMFALLTVAASSQVILTGTSYIQNFNSIGSGLPSGWGIYSSTTISTLGTEASGSFITDKTNWNTATSGSTQFRNVAGFSTTNTGTGASTGSQFVNTDRAYGLRASSAATELSALTLAIDSTSDLENFTVSIDLFTGNVTGSALTVSFEYRIGEAGDFTSVGSYTTTDLEDGTTTLTANSVALSSLNNQSATVYFRVRGVSSDSTATHTLVVDNFSLTYSAVPSAPIPEPSTYGIMAGAAILGCGVLLRRKAIVLT